MSLYPQYKPMKARSNKRVFLFSSIFTILILLAFSFYPRESPQFNYSYTTDGFDSSNSYNKAIAFQTSRIEMDIHGSIYLNVINATNANINGDIVYFNNNTIRLDVSGLLVEFDIIAHGYIWY